MAARGKAPYFIPFYSLLFLFSYLISLSRVQYMMLQMDDGMGGWLEGWMDVDDIPIDLEIIVLYCTVLYSQPYLSIYTQPSVKDGHPDLIPLRTDS